MVWLRLIILKSNPIRRCRVDSYVIRIYRRDARKPGNIAGQVEFVEREETRSFGGADELMDILAGSKCRKWKLKPQKSSKQMKKEKSVKKEKTNSGHL